MPNSPDARPAESIADYLRRMNRETSLAAAGHPGAGGAPGAWGLIASPFSGFLRAWIAGGEYRRGAGGFVRAALTGIGALVLAAKRWEYAAAPGGVKPPADEEGIRAVERRFAP
jgi:hypothetical protein